MSGWFDRSHRFDGTQPWTTDLVGVVLWTVIASFGFVALGDPSWVMAAVGLPLLVFLPGYALMAAIFPAAPSQEVVGERFDGGRTSWVGRLAMAIAASPVIVAAVGYLLSLTVGIGRVPAVVGIGTVTVLGVLVAGVRRNRLAPNGRAAPLDGALPVVENLFGTSGLQKVTTAVALIAFVVAVAYVGVTPADGDAYSEVALLSENETGDLVATGYTSTYVAGQEEPHHIAVWNHEGNETTYGVVTVVQSVDSNGSVTAQQRLDETTVTVEDGKRAVVERSIAPTMTGSELRLHTAVYKGGLPDEPRPAEAPYSVHRWIVVEGG
ncbi:Membrane associated protein with extracellular Ig-like domain, a component of a putative secretion system [Halanaeroarchaeum sp. HSR-CO]|uniref:DUF1616 domain-containing protein n=1 Tax=Halanaeroarchaeum sp. HSR-CO TaxID=2866382 RepID=UPI00217DAB4A|nr:DUF1616 domain-containing protein [Halanaeroarchaeum sp. HSR-CO]UWG47978.1 Membrane associated protein with extracellular Ig-like domain, a component of a putative secretion system [Halanaeroarchaeum sp. HSR-CO]